MPSPLVIKIPLYPAAELEIIFDWVIDRWMHRIVFVGGGQPQTIMQTIEGDQQSIWPPSPPLQDASQHDLASGPAVLAVGMAGTSHWSASFSVEGFDQESSMNSASNHGNLLADLACLCKGQPPTSAGHLVSSYQLEPGVEVVGDNRESENQEFEVRVGNHRLKLLPLNGGGWTSNFRLEGDRLSISPTAVNGVAGKPTRWGYRMMP
jgi:hypothetical protein